ncbi:hypothetical protein RHMOL_Rhmol04G0284700 [Rhododendron molle]|uniref:Uncharacterized protein n=2 Tax=Rhododendron molle TaxID=49168 RepID=A0ACC0M284_RHOML|nr:hypothetical protein RHMOL_Rhmol10G0149300 [Rhododendron molle]KAI8560807.1 hypothetical protein RHMOL_Rhmol04G0284700 [Rhododendron molle]
MKILMIGIREIRSSTILASATAYYDAFVVAVFDPASALPTFQNPFSLALGR